MRKIRSPNTQHATPNTQHPTPADTIVAVATAPGEAGIGIVRASGPGALAGALCLFRRPDGVPLREAPRSHRVTYGYVRRAASEEKLDDCVLTYFAGPRSYTGEDVVELACHGSNLVLAQLLNALIAGGARLAEPGEFTQRAFLNGRLDLAEAEAVIDIIRARTDAALRVATGQLSGRLSREIAELRLALITLLAEIEAAIDFPDDVEPPPDAELAERAAGVRERAQRLLRTADAGRLYREGAALVLAGRPNVGKSSLLNALLGEARAIVTEVPGTTRDVIEESLNLRGIPVRAIDTAGLRDTADTVEALGVERTRAQLAAADLVVWLLEGPAGLTADDEQIAHELSGRRVAVVVNKIDHGDRITAGSVAALLGEAVPVLRVSALTGEGLEALQEALAAALLGGDLAPESVWVSNTRHQARLRSAVQSLDRAVEAAEAGFDQAAISLDLKLAAEALGEITGETVTEETISQIFARFCVGK
ncbi:MAG: mnmE [Armatimonadetes bacterium]|jgi:tRNA modification GTPase|nr:mnmE [Armatimonadota bacterium]